MAKPRDWIITASEASPRDMIGTAGDDILVAGPTETYTMEGLAGDDILVGNNDYNDLLGGTGNDILYGGMGLDYLSGGSGADRLQGGSSSDVLFGGRDADELHGGAGADNLYGGQGDDVSHGGAGDDYLAGSGGNDTLIGGEGRDTFAFSQISPATGADTIADFKPGEDTIQLPDIGLPLGEPVPEDAFVASATGDATDANDRILYETDTGKLFYDADGSGAGEKILFAIIGVNNHPTLTAGDLVVVSETQLFGGPCE